MKTLQLFKILQEIFRFFQNFIAFFAKIWTKCYKYVFVWVREAEPPKASEFTKILVEKSMETCNF